MNKLHIDLENCYGIKKLNADFDFTTHRACAIYAPNGSMKSSLAKTFQDIIDGKESKDRIFSTRLCKRAITDEHGNALAKDNLLVVRPYDKDLGHSEKTSTLLVNATLRREYEQLHVEIDETKERLLKALKKQSGSKKNLEKEISSTFTATDDQFIRALLRIKDELLAQTDAPFAEVQYDTIFDEKVLSVLETRDFKTAIEDYIKKYNELLEASTYFKKGTFNYFNAATIAKNLASNGFFKAKHSINLNAKEKVEILDEKALEALINKEKEGISKDADLRKKYAELEKLIQQNVNVRDFEAYLQNHEELLPNFRNMASFKEEIWKSYFFANLDLYKDLLGKYQAAEQRKGDIEQQAAAESTQWESVIEIFNSRFFVPFKLVAKNKISVMLGLEKMLTLGFTFDDGTDTAPVEQASLLEVLSTGEKKALYILNIIFEIEVRKMARKETLLIVDDIADSFDYKNKYAIIQYLHDTDEDPLFSQIILTHNFDFYRTISSRFVKRSHCFMASKNSAGLTLNLAAGIQNVFVNSWKPSFSTDPKKRIASIPFMRNLIEFTKGNTDPDYIKLTSLLHWKSDSSQIKEDELFNIYNNLFCTTLPVVNSTVGVVDAIHQHANDCLSSTNDINFENKIVLSIAVRLRAEQFMVDKINDANFVSNIHSDQTPKLLKEFKIRFPSEHSAIKAIQRVILMTPENIHLNSFMYEPIIDMSDEHLKQLYTDVLALT